MTLVIAVKVVKVVTVVTVVTVMTVVTRFFLFSPPKTFFNGNFFHKKKITVGISSDKFSPFDSGTILSSDYNC